MKKLAVLVVALAAVFFASPAQAQYGGGFTVQVSAYNVTPGETVVLSGTCAAGGTVAASVDGTTLGTDEAGTDGAYSISITIPQLTPGDHTLATTCGGESQNTTIHVGGAGNGNGNGNGSGSGTNAALVRTGSSGTGSLLRWGGVLVLGGAAVLLVGRRYRTA